MMSFARTAAARSTCSSRKKVGAVATVQGRVVMTAYNGVPGGVPHCDEVGCQRLEDGKHAFLLHAEENLVAQAARFKVQLQGTVVYVTHFPCSHCMAILAQAGVARVVWEGSLDGYEAGSIQGVMAVVEGSRVVMSRLENGLTLMGELGEVVSGHDN